MKPSPSDGGGTSTTSPAPSDDWDLCYAETVEEDCPLSSKADNECAVAVCNTFDNKPNTCGEVPKPQHASGGCTPDVPDIENAGNVCVAAYECNGVECVATYKTIGTPCDGPEDNDGYDSVCVEYKCQPDTAEGAVPGRTICKEDIQVGKTCSAEKDRGDCDIGNKCSADGQCSSVGSYASTNVVCRDSAGPCDAPEYCPGEGPSEAFYKCPEDIKYGPDVQVFNESGNLVKGDKVCRGTCESCPDDVPEVCPGGQNACPSDVIFQKELDVIAGQQYDAGYTTITATELDEKTAEGIPLVEVCVTIKLENGWELQKDDSGATKQDSIKMELNNVGGLEYKSPGGFSYKDLAARYDAGVTECYSFPSEPTTIYFTAHLDVVGLSGSETAWPKLPTSTNETVSTTTGSLSPHVFVKKSPKKGPNVQVATTTEDGGGGGIGWGNWFTFSIGCASVNDKCSTSTSTGGGETTSTTTSTVAPTTTGVHTYTCTSNTSDELTCQHDTSVGSACGSLFGN